MKKIIAILLCWLLAVNISVLFVSAEDGFVWDGRNRIIVKLETPTETHFDTQDFPEIECSAVYILEKIIVDEVYCYTLILDISESSDVEEAVFALLENPLVTSASTNHYEDDYNKVIQMKLSKETVYVSLGGKTELCIEKYDSYVHASSWNEVVFSIDPNVIDEDALTKNMFYEQGIVSFWPFNGVYNDSALEVTKSENHLYCGEVDETDKDFYNAAYIETADAMARLEGVNSVYISEEVAVGGGISDPDYYYEEIWQSDNTEIAEVSTYGETVNSSTGNVHNKTATITGVAEGETTVTVIRKGNSGWVKEVCKVRVFTPCDVNGDGVCNNLDATAILKHDAGINELPEESLEDYDLNGDRKVNNLDASTILKYDAGLI